MKTITKVLLLLFGVSQLIFILYLSIPCISRKIANEELGTTYQFRDISFNLLTEDYTEVLEVKEKLIERGDDPDGIMVLKDENSNTFTILYNTGETIEEIEESFNAFSNPFKHRSSAKKIDSDAYKYSERIEQDEYVKTRYTIYKGKDKIALISSTTDRNQVTKYFADVRVKNFYISIIPHQPDTDNSMALGNIMEFIRTANVR